MLHADCFLTLKWLHCKQWNVIFIILSINHRLRLDRYSLPLVEHLQHTYTQTHVNFDIGTSEWKYMLKIWTSYNEVMLLPCQVTVMQVSSHTHVCLTLNDCYCCCCCCIYTNIFAQQSTDLFIFLPFAYWCW